MVFWAGLIGAVLGAAAGTYQKRRAPDSGPLVAAVTAVVVFVFLTGVAALLT